MSTDTGLVDEEDSTECAIHDGLHAQCGLTHIARHQSRAVHLHQVPPAQHAQLVINAPEKARHRGLAGAGVSGEHQVLVDVDLWHAAPHPGLVEADEVDEVLNLGLHGGQADEAIEFVERGVGGLSGLSLGDAPQRRAQPLQTRMPRLGLVVVHGRLEGLGRRVSAHCGVQKAVDPVHQLRGQRLAALRHQLFGEADQLGALARVNRPAHAGRAHGEVHERGEAILELGALEVH